MRNLSFALLLSSLALTSLAAGCRTDVREEPPPATDTLQAPAAETPAAPSTPDTSSLTDTATGGVSIDTGGTRPTTGDARPASNGPGWNRAELVKGVQGFVTAIDSNNQSQFWGSLSARSMEMVDRSRLTTREEVWKAARETLGDIENRRITVIGGSRDSVSLRIEGLRMIDGVREDDPVIIHLLREGGAWKVMYPGLLYPQHHLRR